MLKRSMLLLVIVVFAAGTASAQWSDDFESYLAGSGLHGQGGWLGWDGNPAFDATVSDAEAFSGTKSAKIDGTSDIVQEFAGYTTGVWTMTCQTLLRSSYEGDQYFIMLNTYAIFGVNNWSTQIHFVGGNVLSDMGGETLPYILGEWVELRGEIDLDNNSQTWFYGGNLLSIASWTEGISGGGALNIGALDLFGNASARSMWYDDFELSGGVVATEEKSWSDVKGLFR